jgi:hypothetical protein
VLGTVPDVCKANRNCNTSEISISIFMSVTLTYSHSYLMLDPRQINAINSFHFSTQLPKARAFRWLSCLTSKRGGSSWAQVWAIKL